MLAMKFALARQRSWPFCSRYIKNVISATDCCYTIHNLWRKWQYGGNVHDVLEKWQNCMSTVWNLSFKRVHFQTKLSPQGQKCPYLKRHWLLRSWVKGLPNALPNAVVFPRNKEILCSSHWEESIHLIPWDRAGHFHSVTSKPVNISSIEHGSKQNHNTALQEFLRDGALLNPLECSCVLAKWYLNRNCMSVFKIHTMLELFQSESKNPFCTLKKCKSLWCNRYFLIMIFLTFSVSFPRVSSWLQKHHLEQQARLHYP